MNPFEAFNTAISGAEVLSLDGPAPKMLFICGAPRSGTTILCQSLSYCGEVGYIDNLIARFASNPVLGVFLSRSLNLPKVFTGHSVFGLTEGLTEPHEFGLGWEKLLISSGIAQPKPGTPLHPDALKNMDRLAKSFDQPVVFKSFAYLWYLTEISRAFPSACFLHISRDISDNAASLEKLYLRRAEDGDMPLWTSAVMQRTMAEGGDLELKDRCILQVRHIDEYIKKCFFEINTDQKYDVALDDYIADPAATVRKIFDYFDIPFDHAKTEKLR